ncbi:hypothetical protein [Oligoflexus tunisiensis]|uniref:hypothetical protein n=1 Tax=Oligoflexus tunisiensis TaxID=708132 RepID=UPI00114D0F7D|nr:hypothetical protein [Oligoflexus tunisiensis]
MSMTAQKTTSQPPMANSLLAPGTKTQDPAAPMDAPQTDMVMLQKADVWMSQFKTRLNIGIIALVVLWGCVSYLKSTTMQLDARTAPEAERILADGSAEEVMTIHAVEGALERSAVVETVKVEDAKVAPPVNAVKAAVATRSVKRTLAQKTGKSKTAAGKSRQQKKPKKSLASKPAL